MVNGKPAVPDPQDLRALTSRVLEYVQREAERTAKEGTKKKPPVSWWKEAADGVRPVGSYTISIWEAVQKGLDRAPVFCFASEEEDRLGYGYAMDQAFMHVRHFVRKAWEDGLRRTMLDDSVQEVAKYFCRRGFWVIFSIRQPHIPRLYACWSVEKPHPQPGECLVGLSLLQGVATGVITRPPPKSVDVSPPPVQKQERRGVPVPEADAPQARVRVSRAEARLAQAVWPLLNSATYTQLDRQAIGLAYKVGPDAVSKMLTALVKHGVLQKSGQRYNTKYRRGIPNLDVCWGSNTVEPEKRINLDEPAVEPAPPQPTPTTALVLDPSAVLNRQLELLGLHEQLAELEAREDTIITEATARRNDIQRQRSEVRAEYHQNLDRLSEAVPGA